MKQSSGEIGCSLSHLRAAEMALEIDAPYVLVMEPRLAFEQVGRRARDSSPGARGGLSRLVARNERGGAVDRHGRHREHRPAAARATSIAEIVSQRRRTGKFYN